MSSGTPTRYRVALMADGEYFDVYAVWDGDTELSDDEAAARLNAQDTTIAELRAQIVRMGVAR
jgi:hypothetical protein